MLVTLPLHVLYRLRGHCTLHAAHCTLHSDSARLFAGILGDVGNVGFDANVRTARHSAVTSGDHGPNPNSKVISINRVGTNIQKKSDMTVHIYSVVGSLGTACQFSVRTALEFERTTAFCMPMRCGAVRCDAPRRDANMPETLHNSMDALNIINLSLGGVLILLRRNIAA